MNFILVIKRTVTILLAVTAVTTAVFTANANAHALIGEFLGPNNPLIATETKLSAPAGVAVLADGSVLIADTHTHRVLCVSPDRGHVGVFAGTGKWGDEIVADDSTKTELGYPGGVAVLADGSVLIADTSNHRVLRVSGI